jgi:hypothetical protein
MSELLLGIDYTEYFCMELIIPSIPVRIGYTEYFYTALITSSISVRHWLHQVFLYGISYTEYFWFRTEILGVTNSVQKYLV